MRAKCVMARSAPAESRVEGSGGQYASCLVMGTLKKVATKANSEKEMMNSAMAKLREFADLGYPASVRKDACCRVASSFGGAI